MDFRMEKSSWVLIIFMIATMAHYMVSGATEGLTAVAIMQVTGYVLLTVFALVALSSIPVVIYCYVVKKIPDIDYSIRVAAVITLIGIISEQF